MQQLERVLVVCSLLVLTLGGGAQTGEGAAFKIYGVEACTIKSQVDGVQKGTVVEHFKGWGDPRVEITHTQMRMSGFTIPHNQKVITEGEWITTVDLDKGTATRTRNPMYEALMQQVKKRGSGVVVGKDMLKSMGGQPTGETATYVNKRCEIWYMAQLGLRVCMTADGLTLWHETNLSGMRMTKTAVEINCGDPGPDDAYKPGVEVSTPSQGPGGMGKGFDMQKLREMMQQRR